MSNISGQPINQPKYESDGANPSVIVDGIHVEGNVNGNIVVGNNNIIYSPNITHGDVIKNYTQSVDAHPRAMKPQPPYAPRGFIGRELTLEILEDQIDTGEATLVYGQDGLGKTSLVKVAANGTAAKSRSDGVLYIEGIDQEEGTFLGFQDIVQQFFNALFESNPPLKVDIPTARTYLSNTAPLVILDHYELPTSSLITLRDLFPRGAIMATARAEIYSDNYLSEEVYPLNRDKSISLLSSKAGVENNASNSGELNKICDLLADVPLAIIKTANIIRNKRTSLGTIVEQLSKISPPSQDRIQAAIERSYGLIFFTLNENERSMLIQAAAAPGISVDRDWLRSLKDGEAVSNSLESMELLQANSPRLRLAEGLRRVVISSSRSGSSSRKSLLEYLLRKLKSNNLDFEFVGGELGNILGLVQWTYDQQRWPDTIALGRAIDPYLTLHGLWDARKTVLNLVTKAALKLEINDSQKGRATQGWALHQLGSMEAGLGSKEQARDILSQALEVRKSLKDKAGIAFTQYNIWVLFPPVIPKEPDSEPSLAEKIGRVIQKIIDNVKHIIYRFGIGDGIHPIVILALIALVALIVTAILFWGNVRWKTYQNDDFGFKFRYPARSELSVSEPRESGIGTIQLPTASSDFFEKSLTVTANRGRSENRCGIPINPDGWRVEPITVENIQFLKATKKTVDNGETGYVVFATPKETEPGTWVCLIFTYSPREPSRDKTSDTFFGAEIAIFEKIVYTFSWTPQRITQPTTKPAPPVIATTPAIGITPETGIPPEYPITPGTAITDVSLTITPDTITPTYTNSPTLTPSPTASFTTTSTFTPSYTPTVCSPTTRWPTYTVQSGDTLFQISLWYRDIGLTVQELQKANCKDTSTTIFVGERLYVPRTPPPGSIVGYLYSNANYEIRLSGVDVVLENSNGVTVATFKTNDDGEYEFLKIPFGIYYIFEYPVTVKPDKTTIQNFKLAPVP